MNKSIMHGVHNMFYFERRKDSRKIFAGFDLLTHDSYFTILIEVFTNHILA